MPRWLVTCPECGHAFTHTEIEPAMIGRASRDPFGVLPKPQSDEKRTCPDCKTESVFQPHHLFYRGDARGHTS
jgi:endogenous inhibitor of DNA gyrase (YacG/DUF329 family)